MNELEIREDREQFEIRNPQSERAFYLFCLARSDCLLEHEKKSEPGPLGSGPSGESPLAYARGSEFFHRFSVVDGTGVDGQHPLFLWRFLDITAVLSMVSLEEFCGPSAELRMQDLTWVGPRACRHEQVVERVMRHSPVLPARFGTLFSSLESLGNFLKKRHGVILEFLDRVADKEEWAIKGLLDRARAREDLLSTTVGMLEPSISCLPPGMRYLREQRIRGEVEKELNCWLKETCIGIATDLSSCAPDSCEHRVLSLGEAGSAREVVFNRAFLAPRSVVGDVRARIDRTNAEHAARGLFFELSGPWPPYSFCPRSLTEPVA